MLPNTLEANKHPRTIVATQEGVAKLATESAINPFFCLFESHIHKAIETH